MVKTKGVRRVVVETVFWCENCTVMTASTESSSKCPECGEVMTEAGFFEH